MVEMLEVGQILQMQTVALLEMVEVQAQIFHHMLLMLLE
jgi:hypothetical protein